MARKTVVLMPSTEQILKKMGTQIKRARLRRNIRAELLAERAGISKATLSAIEKGVSTVSIGAYAVVLFSLGMDKDFELIALDEEQKRRYREFNLKLRERARKREVKKEYKEDDRILEEKNMSREDNLAIFKDTERICQENVRLRESITKSIARQKIILEEHIISEVDKLIYREPAKIVVSKKRSYEAASSYKGKKVCVHNFASATNPGGGVTRGSSAQEECLCRCSSLYFCLDTQSTWNGFYKPHRSAHNPIHNDDIIYLIGF